MSKAGNKDCHSPCNGVHNSHHGNSRNSNVIHARVPRTTYQGQGQIARFPEYSDKRSRLVSYISWRHSHNQDSTRLANNGFFYTEEGDLVRCFSCGLGLKDFLPTDDPLHEHVKYSGAECDFLVQLMGPQRLREIQASLLLHNGGASAIENFETERSRHGNPGGIQNRDNPKVSQGRQPQRYHRPEYRPLTVRESSFRGWPGHMVQTPRQLAEAGFYYTGASDVVRCFACDGGLKLWSPTDDPWIEHCVNYPHCDFLKEIKGEDYIALVVANHPKAQRPAESNGKSEQNFTKTHRGEADQGRQLDRTTNHVEVQVISMGFSPEEVQTSVAAMKKEGQPVTVETLLDQIETIRQGEAAKPSEIVLEHRKLKSQLFCMECTTEEINTLFLPCQHHRLCYACAEKVTCCPICGCSIDQKVKTYRP